MLSYKTLILGIGNLLWADEGFGVRMVELLHQRYEFSTDILLLDGGTQGLYLLPYVQQAQQLLIFDAIEYGLPPGTIKVLQGTEVPSFMGAKKMSLHQTGFQEVLASAQLLGTYPQAIVLIGIQPETLEDYGGSLTTTVKNQMENALTLGIKQLATWGITPTPRTQPPSERLNDASLHVSRYEQERPTAEAACRIGDERVLLNNPEKS